MVRFLLLCRTGWDTICAMERILNVYKPRGMTPLQLLDRLRKKYPEYKSEKMTYAGRLDPMAEGVLVVLVGDAVHDKERYLVLDKIYEADIAFGFGTDTHDVLGLPTMQGIGEISDKSIVEEIRNMEGEWEYPFPIYSSKPVEGKPLFQWARENRIDEIDIPKRKMRIYKVTLLGRRAVSARAMKKDIEKLIANVRGDFRQREIIGRWKAVFGEIEGLRKFPIIRMRIDCASGTYIRTITHELGRRLGTDAVLMKLVRTKVGPFDQENSSRLGG